MAKKTQTKGKGFTGRTAAWIGLAGAAVVGLYFWSKRGKGRTLKCHYSFNHQGLADTSFKTQISLGTYGHIIPGVWDTRDELKSSTPSITLGNNPTPVPVEGDISFIIPTSAAPSEVIDIEFCILDAAGNEYPNGIGKTKDIQENRIELLGTGDFNLV